MVCYGLNNIISTVGLKKRGNCLAVYSLHALTINKLHMSMTKATAEIMAIFEKMEEEEDTEDTFVAIAEGDGAKAGASKKRKLSEGDDEKDGESKKLAGGELSELLTTDEAVELALAASQYYVNKNTDGDFDGLACAGGFGMMVYHKARDVLKPQYKDDFDVKAIAKHFNKMAKAAWDC